MKNLGLPAQWTPAPAEWDSLTTWMRQIASEWVEADQPCALLIKETAKELAISVSNPSQTGLGIGVEMTRGKTRRVVFNSPDGEYTGKTITKTLAATPVRKAGNP